MKRVRDFVAGKVRRTEVEHALRVTLEGEDDAELGAFEAGLASDRGTLSFFSGGVRLSTGLALPYEALSALRVEGTPGGPAAVVAERLDGVTVRIDASPEGAVVVHATLRWVVTALLRRRLAP